MAWHLKTRQRLVVFALLALIVAVIFGLLLTRNPRGPAVANKPRWTPLVDERSLQTARSLTALASNPDEQRLAREALRLADHAVDLTFAMALRDAALEPPPSDPKIKELFAHVRRAQAQVKGDQELIESIKKDAIAAKTPPEQVQQQVDVFQAQLEFDNDELDKAQGDLLRSGADHMGRIRRQFDRYKAAAQHNDASSSQSSQSAPGDTAPANNLLAQIAFWRTQRASLARLQQARDEALAKREELKRDSEAVAKVSETAAAEPAPPTSGSQDAAVVASLKLLAAHQKDLADLNRLVQDHQDLADVYGNWMALVASRQQETFRRMLEFALLILLVALFVYLTGSAVDAFFTGFVTDSRRARAMRVAARFGIQALGVLIVAFVLLGVPAQMPTILGLVGAGLTVVLKDFIVGFFGWFTLMGRNGIRVGDWVEIEGVVGEVAEITLLRTVLLETGNWNDAGHPTGRKVAFVNSYAIEGHYFNFSTSGQWLWDELKILVPAGQDPFPVLDAIQKLVTETTAANAQGAEDEWKRATQKDRMPDVSAAPAINLRPTSSGFEIQIRYITRAQDRYSTRTKLYSEIATLLHQREAAPAKD